MKKIGFFLTTFLIVQTIFVKAQDKKVAVWDPAGSITTSIREIVREEISNVVVNTPGYAVLERQLIDKVLAENKFQSGGLVDDSQITEMGKMMGADVVFVSSVTLMEDGNYYMSFKMIDVFTAKIEKQRTARTRNKTSDIFDVVQKGVEEMFGKSTTTTTNTQQQTQTQPQQKPPSVTQSNQNTQQDFNNRFNDDNNFNTSQKLGINNEGDVFLIFTGYSHSKNPVANISVDGVPVGQGTLNQGFMVSFKDNRPGPKKVKIDWANTVISKTYDINTAFGQKRFNFKFAKTGFGFELQLEK